MTVERRSFFLKRSFSFLRLTIWSHEAHATNLILKTPAFCKIPEQRILFLRYQFKTITIFNFNFDVKFNFSRIGVSAATSFLGLILIITRPIICSRAVLLI
jgi:hypothetical protein